MTADRIALAEAFLQEAVFESRAKQAAGTALAAGASSKPTNCGLGREAAIELGLSPRGRELFEALFAPAEGAAGAVAERQAAQTPVRRDAANVQPLDTARTPSIVDLTHLREVMRAWIERQDQLDRDRNHFLKAFRQRHGFDRRAYSGEQLAEYDSGLAAINARADAERREHASRLLG